MSRELQPLVSPQVQPAPNLQVVAPPPSRWRALIYYLPDMVGSGFGGVAWGASGSGLAAKVIGSGGIAVGTILGIVLDLQEQRKRLGDAFQNRKVHRIVTTTIKHVLVSAIFAAALGLGLHFGTK